MQRIRRTDRADRGAAGIEYTGLVVLASLLVGALVLALVARTTDVTSRTRWAICEILTLGQGSCGSPTGDPQAHVPTEPCVQASDATTVTRELTIVSLGGAASNSYMLEQLSDGRWRVSELNGGDVHVSGGVGGAFSITTPAGTFGLGATAEAKAALEAAAGRVWYTSSKGEANRLISNLQGDTVQDVVAGGNPVTDLLWSGGRWVVDQVTGHDSGYPKPDATQAEGGVTLNASADALAYVAGAHADGTVSTVLGTQVARDGTTTVYLKTELSAQGVAQVVGLGGRLEGDASLVTTLTLDSSGALTSVSTEAEAGGEAGGAARALFGGPAGPWVPSSQGGSVVYGATLDVRNPQDAAVAQRFLVASGIAQLDVGSLGPIVFAPAQPLVAAGVAPSALEFISAAKDHGVVTRQNVDGGGWAFGANGEVEAGVKVGLGGEVENATTQVTSASYWDGSQWVPWKACA